MVSFSSAKRYIDFVLWNSQRCQTIDDRMYRIRRSIVYIKAKKFTGGFS